MAKNNTINKILIKYALKCDMTKSDNIISFYNEVSDYVRYEPTLKKYGDNLNFGIRVSLDGTLIFIDGYNLISALAICNIFPENYEKIIVDNVYVNNNKIYTFDNENNLLKIEKI